MESWSSTLNSLRLMPVNFDTRSLWKQSSCDTLLLNLPFLSVTGRKNGHLKKKKLPSFSQQIPNSGMWINPSKSKD
jgi:hypothetical protein